MPDNTDYARLGNIKFDLIGGITGFQKEAGYDYAQIDIINGKQTLQAMGEKLNKISIDIKLRTFINEDVPGTIAEIDKITASGEPQLLVFASGVYQGKYVVDGSTTSILRTDYKGAIIDADLTLQLLEYSDRQVATTSKTEKKPAGEGVKRKVKIV